MLVHAPRLSPSCSRVLVQLCRPVHHSRARDRVCARAPGKAPAAPRPLIIGIFRVFQTNKWHYQAFGGCRRASRAAPLIDIERGGGARARGPLLGNLQFNQRL